MFLSFDFKFSRLFGTVDRYCVMLDCNRKQRKWDIERNDNKYYGFSDKVCLSFKIAFQLILQRNFYNLFGASEAVV